MNVWFESKKLLVLLVGIAATSAWDGAMPTPNVDACTVLCTAYLAAQGLADLGKGLGRKA
jgi:hypothetical protein